MERSHRLLAVVAVLEAALIALLAAALLQRPTADGERAPRGETAPETGTVGDALRDADRPRPAAADLPAAAGRVETPAAPAPATTALLFGQVLDADGAPIDDVRLTLRRGGATSTERVAGVSLRRDADARFAIPGLAPGAYTLDATAAGFRSATVDVVIPDATDRLRQDVRLARSWELRVQIDTADGQPLFPQLSALCRENPALFDVRVDVVATVDPPPTTFPATDLRSNPFGVGRWAGKHDRIDNGSAPLPERYAGLLELPDDRPMHVSAVLRTAVLATERVEPGQREVALTVPLDAVLDSLCTVRLRVVDGVSGEPVPTARVALTDAQSGSAGQPVDDDGRIELRSQRPGRLELGIRVPGRMARAYGIELRPGASVDLGAIPVFEVLPVQVTFDGIDADTEVRLGLKSLDPSPAPALQPRSMRFPTRPAAPFSQSLAPGRYRLSATASGARGDVDFDTADHAEVPVVVRMRPVAGCRIVPPGAGPPIELTLEDGAGQQVFRRWVTWTAPFDLQLPPGDYTARVAHLDGKTQARTVSVTAAGGELDLR